MVGQFCEQTRQSGCVPSVPSANEQQNQLLLMLLVEQCSCARRSGIEMNGTDAKMMLNFPPLVVQPATAG